jgi:TonB-linked SusC/RagA family outer membrane protein
MKKLLSFWLLFFCLGIIHAQQKTISGKVTDDKGNPIPEASVKVKGSPSGTITDKEGAFKLSIKTGDKSLVVTSVGFAPQEISIGSTTAFSVSLKSATESLDEIVVVAYGTKKKSEFTGSASTLSNKEFANRPVTNVVNALAGSAPGIQTTTTGQPGDPIAVRVRGFGSLSASNGPLIVVDGSPYEGSIAQINPQDIESLTTLKDAATTALYGSRASNGVLMITTKSGANKKGTLSFQLTTGSVTALVSEYNRVNPFDYYKLMWEAMRNSRLSNAVPSTPAVAAQYATDNIAGAAGLKYNPFNVPGNQVVDITGQVNPNARLLWGDDLDWTKDITRIGKRQNAGMTYSGGNDKTDYFGSVGYTNEEGFTIDAALKRYSARLSINTRPTNWFKTGINVSYGATEGSNAADATSGLGASTSFVNPFFFARTIGPIYPVYAHNTTTGDYLLDPLGNKIFDYASAMVTGNRPTGAYGGRHVVAETKWNNNSTKGSLLSGRTYFDVTPMKDMVFSVKFGADVNNSSFSQYQNNLVGDGAGVGILDKIQSLRTTYTLTQQLTYKKKLGMHNMSFLAGHENYNFYFQRTAQQMQGQNFPGIFEFANFTTMNSIESRTDKYRIESYFGGATYDYDGKYLLSLSIRRDGNSRFAEDVRWKSFYGAGVGWVVSKENFLREATWINSLKLRGTYGNVGNDRLLDANAAAVYYGYQAVYRLGFTNAGTEPGALLQNARPNNNLTWEEAKTFDAGIDFSLFKDRVYGSVEWYHRNTDKMIFDFQFPPSSGGNTVGGFSEFRNIGKMTNSGIEIDLHADVVRAKNFTWNVAVNATTLKNVIKQMPEANPTIISGTKQYEVGRSIYDYWLREYRGVDPNTGSAIYTPLNTAISTTTYALKAGDTVTTDINNAKKIYAGSAIPKLFGGFSTSLRYKFLEVQLRFRYQIGGKTYDQTYAQLMSAGNYGVALHSDMLKRWQNPGDITNVPRMDANKLTDFGAGTSTRWLTDASFLSFENITVSHDLPKEFLSKIKATGSKFFISADNIAFIVARKGMNPAQSFSGVTSNVYMPARTVTVGININF